MFYCKYCKKEVILYNVSYNEEFEKGLEDFKEKMESEGKIILFNAPQSGPFNCPVCGEKLRDFI